MAKNVLRTRLCDLLEIEYPIILAGMGGVSRSELVAAVSEAGGLGIIGAASMSPRTISEEVRKVRSLTSKPFGVDLLLPSNAQASGDTGTRLAFAGMEGIQRQLEAVFDERVPVFAAGLGNPAPWVPRMRELNMKVIGLTGNVRNAKRLAAGGVDVVVAQGHEAGGHTGRIGTFALLPQVIDAVDPLPVVAAGGVGDGRALAAVIAMGGVGVWVGTRFIATFEAWGHENYKNKLVESTEEDTVVTKSYSGKPMRNIKNRWTEEWESRPDEIQPFPKQLAVSGARIDTGMRDGDTDYGCMPAGQITGLIQDIRPAKQIVDEMIAQAVEIFSERVPAEVVVRR